MTTKTPLQDILARLRKDSGNEFSSLVEEGTIGDITSYTDTGCYILNAQLSADLFGGLPNGQFLTNKQSLLLVGVPTQLVHIALVTFAILASSGLGISSSPLSKAACGRSSTSLPNRRPARRRRPASSRTDCVCGSPEAWRPSDERGECATLAFAGEPA